MGFDIKLVKTKSRGERRRWVDDDSRAIHQQGSLLDKEKSRHSPHAKHLDNKVGRESSPSDPFHAARQDKSTAVLEDVCSRQGDRASSEGVCLVIPVDMSDD